MTITLKTTLTKLTALAALGGALGLGWLAHPAHGQIAVRNQGFVLFSEDRRAILDILLATKSGLPDEWHLSRSVSAVR